MYGKKIIATIYLSVILFGGLLALGKTTQSQDFTYQKANQDYEFSRDGYKARLFDFNQKKAAYLKNPTLSLKEELRLSLFDFLIQRNNYIVSYLNTLRTKTVESKGLDQTQKETIYARIDTEVAWYNGHKNEFAQTDLLETLLEKSAEEDTQWQNVSIPSVNYTLALISLGEVVDYRNQLQTIYSGLKNEADSLVALGRADNSLFSRWFNDIELEIEKVKSHEENTKTALNKLTTAKTVSSQNRLFLDTIKTLNPAKTSLLKLNNFIIELENVINTKR